MREVAFGEAMELAARGRLDACPQEVTSIIADVRALGARAVLEHARALDGFAGDSFEVPRARLERALAALNPTLRAHLEEAARRVKLMAARQKEMFRDVELSIDGVDMGHRVVPLRRVACYAPGGRHPLPSSVIMGVVPARVAGVEEVIVLSPRLHDVTAAAAVIAGADRVFDLGGVQGVAAAALGIAGVPRVDAVVGPGNRYVTWAKRTLYGEVGIEFPAGPSELLVVADGDADPALVAADLLAQAEHDPDAIPALVTFDAGLATAVQVELARQLESLPAGTPARTSLGNGFLAVVAGADEAVAVCDAMAPEHLELVGPRAEALASCVRNYGSLFLGPLSAEVFGDYGSGTNHILPTGGAARFTGGVWVGTFLKVLTWQRVGPEGLAAIAAQSEAIALAEGLAAHAFAARMRTPPA